MQILKIVSFRILPQFFDLYYFLYNNTYCKRIIYALGKITIKCIITIDYSDYAENNIFYEKIVFL